MFRRVIIVASILALVLGLSSAAHAGVVDDDYTPSPGLVIDDSNVTPGSTVTVSGSGCGMNQPVTITLLGETVATTTTGADGSFSAAITVPDGTPPGTYTVTATGCGVEVLGVTLTVREAGTADPGGSGGSTTTSGGLPRTGDETATLARIGILLLAVGAFAVFAARRRSANAARNG